MSLLNSAGKFLGDKLSGLSNTFEGVTELAKDAIDSVTGKHPSISAVVTVDPFYDGFPTEVFEELMEFESYKLSTDYRFSWSKTRDSENTPLFLKFLDENLNEDETEEVLIYNT